MSRTLTLEIEVRDDEFALIVAAESPTRQPPLVEDAMVRLALLRGALIELERLCRKEATRRAVERMAARGEVEIGRPS